MSTTRTARHDPAHLSLRTLVLRLLRAFSTLWASESRIRAVGLVRELRRRVVNWFTGASNKARSSLGRLLVSHVRYAEPAEHQLLRCMRWLARCSAREDDSHRVAA